MRFRRPSIATIVASAAAAFLLVAGAATAFAQTTYTWTGGGSDNNWGTAANWTGGVPASSGNSVLVFSGSTRTSSNNNLGDWNLTIGRLEFASGASAFTLSGNSFGFDPYLGSQKQEIFQNSASTQTIGVSAFSFRSAVDSQINLNAGDLVITSPNVYIDSSSTVYRSLYVTGNDTTRRTLTIAGNLAKGLSGNDPDIYIQNNKRLLVTGSITTGSGNDGSIFIDSGVLEFGSTGAMTGGSPVVGTTSGSGTAAVYLNSAGSTFARQLEIRGGSSGQRVVGGLNTSGTATFSGNFVATNSPADYDLKAATGGTVVVSGQRNVAGTLQVNRADGATSFGGTVEISSTATGGSTTTVVNAGTLRVRDLVGDGWGVLRGSVSVNAGAQLDLVGSGAALGWQSGGRVTSLSLAAGSVVNANTQHIWLGGGTVALTAATMQTNGGVSSATGEYFEWGDSPVATAASSGTSVIAGRMRLRGDALSGRILNFTVADGAAATDLLVSAAITEGAAAGLGNAGIAKYGAGTMKLTGSNSFTNQSLIYAGTLEVDSLAQLGTNNVEFNAASGDSGTLRYAGATGSSSQNLYIDNAGITRAAIDVSQAGTTLTWTPAGGTVNQNLTKVGAGTLSYGGAITGGNVSVEAGTLILTASNSFSQWATVVGGALQVSDFNQLGTGHLEFNASSGDSGTLRYTGGSASTTKTLYIDNSGITRAAIDVSQAGTTLTWNPGSSTVNQNLTKVGAGTLSYGGPITGAATVGVEGGTLVLTASNSYTGPTTVSAGRLQVNSSNGITSGTITLGDANTGSNNASLFIDATSAATTVSRPIVIANQGSGTATLGSASTGGSNIAAFSGAVSLGKDVFLNGGTTGDRLGFTGGISGTGNVNVNGSNRVLFSGAANTYSGSTTILAGAMLQLGEGVASSTSFIPDASDVNVAGSLWLAKVGNSETINALTGSGTVQAFFSNNTLAVGGAGGSGTFSGVLGQNGGTLSLVKQGSGTQVLTGANTYTGSTSLAGGTLGAGSAGALGSGGTISFDGGTLQYAGSNTTDYSGRFSTAAGQNFSIDTNGNSVTFASALTSSGGSLTKLGSGSLTLGGSNGFSGGVALNAGTLAVGSANALGSSGTISFAGGTLQYSASNTTDYSGRFSNAASQPYSIDTNGQNVTFGSNLTSSGGSLTKLGSGTLTLGGANSYSGGTVVSAGRLIGTTASLQGAITNNAAVEFAQATSGTYSGVMGGTGSLTKTSSGTVTLSGNNSYSGGTVVSAGRLIGTTATLQGSITNDAAVEFAQATSGTYSGVMGGTGSLTKTSSGTVTLSGNNSYSGGTVISAGRLIGTTDSLQGSITNNAAAEFAQATTGTYAGSMTGSGSFTKTGAGDVTLSGNNSYGGGTVVSAGRLIGTTASLQGSITNNAAVEFAQATSGTYAGSMTGSGSFTKTGAGDVTLSGNNSYGGGTVVSAGRLIGTTASLQGSITNNAAVEFAQATSGTYSGVMGGTGSLTKTSSGTVTLSGNNSYSGGTVISAGRLIGTTDSLQGSITNNAAAEFAQATTGTYAGSMTGSGSFTKTGAGDVTLSGNNSYGGGTVVSAGRLIGTTDSLQGSITNNAAVEFAQAASGTYAGSMTGSGSFTKTGAGNMTLSGTNSYGGGTVVSAGRLIGTTASLQGSITNNAAVEFAQATSGTYSGVMGGTGSLTKTSSGTVTLSGNNSYSGGTLVSAGRLVGTTASLQGEITNDAAVEFAQATSGTYAGSMTGSGSLTKSGAGVLTFTGSSGFTGGAALNAGTLAVGSANALGSSGTISFGGGALQYSASNTTDYSGRFSNAAGQQYSIDTNGQNVTLGSNLTSSGGSFTKLGSGTLTLGGANSYSGGTVVSAGRLIGTTASLQGAITNNAAVEFAQATSGTYSGVMGGTGSLTKTSSGTVTLSGNNSYSGGTVVSAGRLIGTTASLQGAITNNAAVEFAQATSGTYSGVMGGTGSLTKTSSGTVTLSGNNSYSGGTVVSAGRLIGTTATLQGSITNDAAVEFAQATSGTYSGVMGGTGSLTKTSSGTVTLSGNNSYSGGTVISAGRLIGTTASLQGAITNNAAVTFDQSTTGTYAGTMGGTGSLTKSGSGTVVVSGSNSYSGSTSLAGGTLGAGSAAALGSGGTISFDGGTLQYAGSNTTDYSSRFSTAAGQNFSIDTNGNTVTLATALTSSGGSLTKLGAGTLVLTANNALSGNTTISQGTLQVGNGAAAVNISGPRVIAAGARLLISNTAYSLAAGWSTITGAGTLELDGGSTYGNWGTVALPSGFTGTLQVDNAGRFDVSGTSALGNASAVTIQSGAQMLVTSANQTFSQAFSIAGFGSESNWNYGALRTYGNGTVFAGPVTLTGNAGLMTQNHVGNSSLTISGNIGDGGAGYGLTIRSAVLSGNTSPITLSGSNSYSGDTIVTSGSLNIGNRFALAGSTLDTSGAGSFALTAAGTNTYVLGGLKGSKAFAMGANSLEVGGNGQSTTYSGNLSGSGSFSKIGSGTLTVGGSNSYAGITSVNDGGLKLNGSIAGGLNVAALAALSGTGTIGGNATIAGIHSPGNSPGVQSFNGNLTYEAGSLVNWELIANTTGTAGVNYDQILLPTGNLTFSGSTTLALAFNGPGSTVDWSDAFWNVNRAWTVYDLSGGSTSNLSNLILGGSLLDAQGDSLSPTARGYFTTSLAGQDVMLNFVAVPEPSTWCLALAGLGFTVLLSRRRRRIISCFSSGASS